MRIAPLLLVAAALAAASPAPCQDQPAPPMRHDLLRFPVPDGWSGRTVGNEVVLTPGVAGARLVIEHSVPLTGSIEDHLDARLAEHTGRPGYERQGERAEPTVTGTRATYVGELFLLQGEAGSDLRPGIYLSLLAGGGRVTALRFEFDHQQLYERYVPAVGALLGNAVPTTLERLERGRPPLTRYMVDEAVAFLEWLLQSPFTDAQAATVESELRTAWRTRDREEIDGTVELLQARQELAALQPEARELARVQVLEQALEAWRQEQAESRGAAMMLAIHAEVDRVLVAGDPPLKRQAVEAFAEFLHFAGQQVAGASAPLAPELREQLITGVAGQWPRLPRDQRDFVASMPLGWAALRLRWPELSTGEREAMVADWRAMPQIVELGRAIAAQSAVDEAERRAAAERQRNSMSEVLKLRAETSRIHASMRQINISFPTPYRW
ncbi:MAG: hypothetical protein MUC36_04300 [Planctomycetes bacterium]|jgi:hypothetical protein|nr:hypothetical protein [Planctomycetota bacterium]